MRTRSWWELSAWTGLAIAGGVVVAYLDRTANEIQGTILLLMMLDFALTLPGRAPVFLVAVASVVPLNASFVIWAHSWSPAALIILVPAVIAAGGGRLAGRLLEVAAARLTPIERRSDLPWYDRPLDQRVLLGLALIGLAAVGTPMIEAMLDSARARAPIWVALVWQIMTLLGWIAMTPVVLRDRAALRTKMTLSPSASGIGMHVLAVVALCVVHAVSVVSIGQLLLIPRAASWPDLVYAAFATYLPLDLLAYLTITTLGIASDVSAHRRQAIEREAALRAEMVESRLGALRSRLNPHFLFNALGGVRVLAASGEIDRSNEMLAGLTKLLRYVLDEHRQLVPLADELGFTRDYLTVQQARFGDRLRYEIVEEPDAARAAVPQLLLQPLVENAVEHGIEQLLEGGRVRVVAGRLNERLQITIENDGPPADVQESTGLGIGLASTRERLERLYGSAADLRIESVGQGRGSRVVMRLPFKEVQSTNER